MRLTGVTNRRRGVFSIALIVVSAILGPMLTQRVTLADPSEPWDGAVAMTADRSTTDTADSTAVVTASASTVVQGGYVMAIYDDTGQRHSGPCSLTCSVSVQPATNTSRIYTAYVSLDYPATGLPTQDIRAVSSVTVTNVGWAGTVTLTSSTPTTTANDSSALLTATASAPVNAGYVLAIYDEDGQRVSGFCATTCSEWVSPATNTSRTYTAYVSRDYTSTAVPTIDVRSTSSVKVTNLGWVGTVTLTTSSPTTHANDSQALLTATPTSTVNAGYVLAIYDEDGQRVSGYCTSTCSEWVSPATNTSRTYTAYVSRDYTSTAVPTIDVRSTSSVTRLRAGHL